MDVSFVIPSSRSYETDQALKSIKNLAKDSIKFEVIVVKSPEVVVSEQIENMIILNSPVNHASIKRNLGVNEARGKYIAFIDDDIVLPLGWLKTGIDFIEKYGCDGVSGSEHSQKTGFGFQLANIVFLSKFGQAADTHKVGTIKNALFYEMVLCNCIIKKVVFDKVGGFNEIADYHVDDVEFFYIAEKCGFVFMKCPDLNLAHERKPYLFPYIKSLFNKTTWTGIHSMLFPEIYLKISAVKLMLILIVCFPFAAIFLKLKFFLLLLLIYFVGLWIAYLHMAAKNLGLFICVPFAFFIHHVNGTVAFFYGMLKYFFTYKKWEDVREHKNKRYMVFRGVNDKQEK